MGHAHGQDGSFWVEGADHPLLVGTEVTLGGERRRVERRGGTDERPLLHVSGIEAREDAAALRDEPLLVEGELGSEEWLAVQLLGREVRGLGHVRRVLDGPSCALLELDDGTLVPFVSDAIRSVDEVIEIDPEFLGL